MLFFREINEQKKDPRGGKKSGHDSQENSPLIRRMIPSNQLDHIRRDDESEHSCGCYQTAIELRMFGIQSRRPTKQTRQINGQKNAGETMIESRQSHGHGTGGGDNAN